MPLNQAAVNAFLTRAGKAANDLDQNLGGDALEAGYGCDPDTARLLSTAVDMILSVLTWSRTTSDGVGAAAVQDLIALAIERAWEG